MTRSTRGSGDLAFIDLLSAQDRTKDSMHKVLNRLAEGRTVKEACEQSDVAFNSYRKWRHKYKAFADAADKLTKVNHHVRHKQVKTRQMGKALEDGLIFDPDREMPEKPGLVDFRMTYFGRPSPPHHQDAIRAMEDPTNMRVFVFMPTGAGKDTLAGDAVAWLKADDRGKNRVAWFMETEEFSVRRMERLDTYLTDHRVYQVRPDETPGGRVPAADLITDFGPFRWKKGMMYPDGTEVPKPRWTQLTRYFVGSDINEADPDLWATGITGAIYGSRIRTAVLSDVFVPENQSSPTMRAKQLSTLRTVVRSRMDSRGRIWVLGTMLPIDNNYEALMDEWIPKDTEIIYQSDDGHYVQYRNRTAIVRHPAILEEGTDRERSFWEDRFPYRATIFIPTGTFDENDDEVIDRIHPEDLTGPELLELGATIKDTPGAEIVEGLVDVRGEPGTDQWISFQATHQQLRVRKHGEIDFPDEILDLCDDTSRTYGQALPDEVFVQGVDPAKVYGAGLVVWAISRTEGTITAVEVDAPSKLGTVGIKNQLVLSPLNRWMPLWLCFEINRHEGTLDDSAVTTQVEAKGVRIDRIQTSVANRNSTVVGPASLAHYMRQGIIKFPAATEADRQTSALLKRHFKAFERHDAENQRSSRPGTPGWEPDDLALAAWVGFPRALEILERGARRRMGLLQGPVPKSVEQRFRHWKASRNHEVSEREPHRSPQEIVTMSIESAASE